MEPSPPKGRKPKVQRPFYEAARRTSAEIVAEARTNVKTLETNRPFTPLEANRRLFGSASTRTTVGRPPSSLSIGSRTLAEPLTRPSSRPPTGRLSPIDGITTTSIDDLISSKVAEAVEGVKVSETVSDVSASKETTLKSKDPTIPLNTQPVPPMSKDPDMSRTRRYPGRRVRSPCVDQSSERRVQSGPKERTNAGEIGIETAIKRHNSIGDFSGNANDVKYESGADVDRDDTLDTKDNSVVFIHDIVSPLLKQMELNYLHGDIKSLAVNFDVLWETLNRGNLFKKPASSGLARGRAKILRTIFKFSDVDEPKILVKLCKLAFLMNVTGKQQNNICKVLFVISKDQKQDALLKEENLIGDIIEVVANASISSELDWLIYAVGIVKFSAGSPVLQGSVVEKNCLSSFGKLLRTVVAYLDESIHQHVQIPHLLVQVTAAIRNILDISNARKQMASSGIVEILLQLLQNFFKDSDYVLNISRILSKLTLYSDFCFTVSNMEDGNKRLIDLLELYSNSQGIVVRILFTLGNIAAKVDETNLLFFRGEKQLDVISRVCQNYVKKLEKAVKNEKHQNGDSQDNDGNAEKAEDVLIKATRFIANLSVHPSIGPDICNNSSIIDILVAISQSKSCKKNEELIVNTAATLNNISFYMEDGCYFEKNQELLCRALSESILANSLDCTIEITRVFGNLTRSKEVRQVLIERKFMEILITLLDANDKEAIYCVSGALINMMLEKDGRQAMAAQKGVAKLIDALKDFGQTDWQLASLICQILWNFSEDVSNSSLCFGEIEVEDLIDVLQLYLDPEFALDYSDFSKMDSVTKDYLQEVWKEQFVPVSQRLLERIRNHHTDLEPLEE